VILRFNIQEVVYDPSSPMICGPTIQSDYTDISGSILINGVETISFTNLASGTFLHSPLPVLSGNVTIDTVTLENSLYVAIGLTVTNLADNVDIAIVINKAEYFPITRSFTTFGYDIGINPNIPATSINEDMYLVMIPSTYPDTYATSGVLSPAIGITFEIVADNPGTIGNSIIILLPGGPTVDAQVAAWNAANPTNTATLTYTLGAGYTGNTPPIINLAGGSNSPTQNLAYANFVGWREPFSNNLYLYANYSNLKDSVEYRDINEDILATTHSAMLPCYSGPAIKMISTVYEIVGCIATPIDTCTFGDLTFDGLVLIPAFSCGVTCDSCCTDDCLVIGGSNYAQFILDVDAITSLNVDDLAIVSVEEVTIEATVYDACGEQVSTDSKVTPLNPLDPLVDTRVDVIFPEIGDYSVKCVVSSLYFTCEKIETFTGCTNFKIDKLECGKFTVTSLSTTPISVAVESLNIDATWQEYIPVFNLLSCVVYEVNFTEDGIYRIIIEGTTYYVIPVDCAMKACFVEFTKTRVCNPKADCACGGNCGGLCKKTPQDMYDFSAFSILTFNYLALLNGLYLQNFIFTTFQPSDLDTLLTMQQYLTRIKEYCGNCDVTTVDTNTGDCGCS